MAHPFLFPYLASTYVDYVLADNNPDEGMPGGDLWLLPAEFNNGGNIEFVWTTQKLLLWWEDLLGEPLTNHWDKLAGAAGYDSALREINFWKKGRVFDSSTIDRWTRQEWSYKGAFKDNKCLPLATRWSECKAFLTSKEFHKDPAALGNQIPRANGHSTNPYN